MTDAMMVALGGFVLITLQSIICVATMYRWSREQTESIRKIADQAFWHIGAKGPTEVAEAKAVEAYQDQALRQNQAHFDKLEETLGDPPSKRQRIMDDQGREYEVLAGMD